MFDKITDQERDGKGVTGLPDTPEMDTNALQQKFDELGNMAIDAMNRLIDDIRKVKAGDGDKSASDYIGVMVPEGIAALPNLQSVIDALARLGKSFDDVRHTHTNKQVLDTFTMDKKAQYDRVSELLENVIAVDAGTMTASDASVPTSAAVQKAIRDFDYEDVKRSLYPIGTLYMNREDVNPASFIPGTVWALEDVFIDGVFTYRRIN